MRVVAVLLSVCAACYSPSYRDCEVMCASGTCPIGLTCEQGVCRVQGASGACGGVDPDASSGDGQSADGPPGDVDSDGVLNADDNCPNVGNPNQANEDTDLFGDVCDPCPPYGAPGDNADPDSDGVGAACDPSPSPGNSIVVFEGFASGAAPTNAVVQPASAWSYATGTATVANPGVETTMLWPLPAGAGETISASFRVLSYAGTPFGQGVVTRYDTNPVTGIVCWLGNNQGIAGASAIELYQRGGTLNQVQPTPVDFARDYTLSLLSRNGAYTCIEPTIGTLTGPAPGSGPAAGLYGINMSARYNWVMIVSGP